MAAVAEPESQVGVVAEARRCSSSAATGVGRHLLVAEPADRGARVDRAVPR